MMRVYGTVLLLDKQHVYNMHQGGDCVSALKKKNDKNTKTDESESMAASKMHAVDVSSLIALPFVPIEISRFFYVVLTGFQRGCSLPGTFGVSLTLNDLNILGKHFSGSRKLVYGFCPFASL